MGAAPCLVQCRQFCAWLKLMNCRGLPPAVLPPAGRGRGLSPQGIEGGCQALSSTAICSLHGCSATVSHFCLACRRRREEAKARRDAEREQAGDGGQDQPQTSTQIGLSRGDMRPASNGLKAPGSSVDLSGWNVGRSSRGKGPAPVRNTAIDWNVGPTPDASRYARLTFT